jgi:hypothetical protein
MDGSHQFHAYQLFPGGKKAVMDLIEKAGLGRPSLQTANMWFHNGGIPPRYILHIEREFRRLGIEVTDADFRSIHFKPKD